MKKILSLILLSYLRFFARLQLRKNPKAIVIGITGSHGKSSARLALLRVLQSKGIVKHTVHANSESGIPLDILGLDVTSYSIIDWLRIAILAPVQYLINWERYDYYIVEMGMDSPEPPKNMSYLLTIVKPDVAIVLNAATVHGEAFDHLVRDVNPARREAKIVYEIAKEKVKLAGAVSKEGYAILGSQKEFRELSKKVRGRKLTFGKLKSNDLTITSVTLNKSFNMTFTYQSSRYQLKTKHLFEEAYAETFAATILAAAALGIKPSKSIQLLESFEAPPGRLSIFDGINSSHLIDSTYNASPHTVEKSLELLNKLGARNHKIAVIGDMRELGTLTKSAHKRLATLISKHADSCILFGPYTGEYTLPVLEKMKFPVHHFTRIKDLNSYLYNHIPVGSWMLFDGSQNTILLERAVEPLLKNKSDIANLCRREKYWEKVRNNTP